MQRISLRLIARGSCRCSIHAIFLLSLRLHRLTDRLGVVDNGRLGQLLDVVVVERFGGTASYSTVVQNLDKEEGVAGR